MKDIVGCLIGLKHYTYGKWIREFVLTLNFYSPRAYVYLREKFKSTLPHQSTLKKWYANSDANGEPGISLAGVNCLVNLVNEMKRSDEKFYCSLVFDEMYIRRHVQYADNQKQFLGSTTYGNDGDFSVANNVIVFMVNGMNKYVSFPIAHHFINSLDAQAKGELLKTIITEISNTGAELLNIAFDGLVTNFTTCKQLGASFNMNDFRPYFPNPVGGGPIRIILDPCHMLKLARNCLDIEKFIYDGDGRKIEWKHFESLESRRVKNNFITHKLTKKHIESQHNRMNVTLAAQTLSNSVANSLEYLMKEGVKSFINCAGTIQFCRMMNDLFDVFNTGHDDTLDSNSQNIYKVPLSIETAEQILPFLNKAEEYIKLLKIGRTDILKSKKKTGFLGLVINIHNLKLIFDEYVRSGKLKHITTYSLGQDSLESFFSRIRSRCGSNENPTVEQFKSAYRKTLVNKGITSSAFANCQDNLNILFVPSTKPKKRGEEEKNIIAEPNVVNEWVINPLNANDILLDVGEEATVVRRSADIEQKIRSNFERFKCRSCYDVLDENRKVTVNICPSDDFPLPCESTTFICKAAWKYLNVFVNRPIFDYETLVTTILNAIDFDIVFTATNFTLHTEHKHFFIQFIAEEFIRVQSIYIAKELTLREQVKIYGNKIKKRIHALGQ